MKKIILLTLLAGFFIISQAQQYKVANPTISISSEVKFTIPVSQMTPLTQEELQQMALERENRRQEKREQSRAKHNINHETDPVIQNFMSPGRGANAPLLTFEGQQSAGYPSDANGSVDSNYYVQAVNSTFAVYDKNGNKKAGPIALNSLFTGLPGSTYNDGDPIVLYDGQAGRWLISEMSKSGPNDYLMVAVSQTGNPLGAWYSYSFDVDDWPDYPKYGIWNNGYYIGIDKIGNNTEDQEDVFAIERSKMLNGQPARMVGFINPDRPNITYTIAAPVDNEGVFAPANTPAIFLAINDAQWTLPKDQLWIYEMNVDWNNLSNSTFGRVQALDVAAFTPAPDPYEPAGYTLDGLGYYIMNKPVYRNFSTSDFNDQVIVCNHSVVGSSGTNAGIRWYELSKKESGDWTIRQQGTYSPDNDSRWIGSITMNSNRRIAVGYSVSGTSTYPGIRYAAQSPAGYATANGVLDVAEETILNGSHLQDVSRWGDYSNISLDPSNDTVFWYTNQYVAAPYPKTKIAKFKFTNFGLTADFVVNKNEPGVGELVKFKDISYGSPTTWTWSFSPSTVTYAASTNSHSQNPWVQFSNAGTYSVTLQVGDGSSTNSITKTAFITVDTLCLVSSFPWTEDFENSGNIPGCWTQEYVNHYNEDWKFQNGDGYYVNAHSGSYNAFFLKNDTYTRLVLPPLDLSSLTNPQLDFWYAMGDVYNAYYEFKVLYKSSENGVWTVLKTYNSKAPSWTHDSIVLPNNTSDSWIAFESGQNNGSIGLNIDDVTIKESTVSCAPPLGPTTNPSGTSATVAWLPQLYSPTWEIEYGAPGFTIGSGTRVSNITDTSYTITGLTASTGYQWYVRKKCSSTSYSSWTGPISFSTTTVPFALPMTENFETGLGKFSGINFLLNTNLKHNGNQSAYNNYEYSGAGTLTMNSYVDLSQTNNPFLTFWHIGKIDATDFAIVQISTDNGTTWRTLPTTAYEGEAANYSAYHRFNEDSYTGWAGTPATNSWWKKETYSLENFKAKKVKIRFLLFKTPATPTEEGWYIDDIMIEDNPCPSVNPDSLFTSGITNATADLRWVERGSATSWEVEYGLSGFSLGTGTTVSANSNPFTLSSLTSNTEYDWYVRANCGGGTYSEPKGPATFKTTSNPVTLPYFEDFESVSPPNFPSSYEIEDANNDNSKWQSTTGYSFSGNKSIFVGTPSNRAANDWFFTPGITLQAGVSYQIAFVYSTSGGHEILEVKYGDYPAASSMNSTSLFSDSDITSWDFKLGYSNITPTDTKVYYFGFHATNPIGTSGIYLDDIYINANSSVATWSGTSSSDWQNATNWNNDTLPTANTIVNISATATHFPTLTSLATAKDFYLKSQDKNATLMGESYIRIAGNYYLEQHLYAGKWHLITAPVKNATVNQIFLNHNPDVWLTKYNEPTDDWTYITDLNTPLPLAGGYAVWVETGNDTAVTFTGDINSDDIYLDGSQWSTPQLSYTGASHGYNLVGNPFPSALDWDSSGWDTTDISGSIWVWNPITGNYAYRNSQGQGSLTDGIIPRGQGFFIHAKSTNMYFTIPNTARVHTQQNFYKNANSSPVPVAVLDCSKEDMKDEIWISFSEGASNDFNDRYDVEKFFSMKEVPQLWLKQKGKDLSLLSLPPLINNSVVIDLNFKAGPEGVQKLELTNIEQMENTDIFLEDATTGKFVDLKKNPVYEFSATSNQETNRFKLHFTNIVNGIKDNANEDINVYSYNDNIYVIHEKDFVNNSKIVIYDLLGRKLKSLQTESRFVKIKAPSRNQYLIIKLVSNNKVHSKKVFVR